MNLRPVMVMLGGTDQRPCGQAEGRSWRVRLEPPERDDLVLAQLDLG